MATVLIHLNVNVPNSIAEQDEALAIRTAKMQVVSACQADFVDLPAEFESFVAMAEVVDYDDVD